VLTAESTSCRLGRRARWLGPMVGDVEATATVGAEDAGLDAGAREGSATGLLPMHAATSTLAAASPAAFRIPVKRATVIPFDVQCDVPSRHGCTRRDRSCRDSPRMKVRHASACQVRRSAQPPSQSVSPRLRLRSWNCNVGRGRRGLTCGTPSACSSTAAAAGMPSPRSTVGADAGGGEHRELARRPAGTGRVRSGGPVSRTRPNGLLSTVVAPRSARRARRADGSHRRSDADRRCGDWCARDHLPAGEDPV
jgi:hypothetical protein